MKKNNKSYFAYLPGWDLHLSARLAWSFFIIVSILAIFGPFIANEKPYRCTLEGITYYPLFSGVTEAELSVRHPSYSPVDWRTTSFESIWRAPVSYSHSSIDLKSGSQLSPFDSQPLTLRFRHWLGTDQLGHDVLAGMIRGCRISLLIGLGSMLLALLFGVPMGSIAAYWGNREWKVSWIHFVIGGVLLFIIVSVWYLPLSILMQSLVSLLLLVVGFFILFFTKKIKSHKISLPLDAMVMGLISIVDSFPGLFIILIILVLIPAKGWVVVMATIALLRWPSMARYMRAEVFKIKESNYIKAAQVLNLSNFHILRQHIIPYAFRPVMITFIFGISSAILAESSLSFLGIGLPSGEMNWGRLLSESRNHFEAWWLVLFPGCAIFFTLLSLYTIGNAVQKSIEHRA